MYFLEKYYIKPDYRKTAVLGMIQGRGINPRRGAVRSCGFRSLRVVTRKETLHSDVTQRSILLKKYSSLCTIRYDASPTSLCPHKAEKTPRFVHTAQGSSFSSLPTSRSLILPLPTRNHP